MAVLPEVVCAVLALGIAVAGGTPLCKYPEAAGMPIHVLKDPAFFDHFQSEVRQRAWKCHFTPDLFIRDLERDARLYANDTRLRARREGVSKLMQNDTQWAELVLGACKEIADGRKGPHSQQFEDLHLLEALEDFVEHLNCFGVVAMVMASKGRKISPLSQDSSRVHDIDKLDPVMLTGYSERFEDQKATSVWDECVERHTHVNPHHQAHPLWLEDVHGDCHFSLEVREKALSEMVCDKVSRRLQKDLKGVVSDKMWDIEPAYFEGLPQDWLKRAFELLRDMKKRSPFIYSSAYQIID